MYCRKCGTYLNDDAVFCSSCGTRTNNNDNVGYAQSNNYYYAKEQMINTFISQNRGYLPESRLYDIRNLLLSTSFESADTATSIFRQNAKEPTVALLLSIFTGSMGIDRFYIGDISMGLVKLLTCAGLGIIYIYDLFVIMKRCREENYRVFYEKIQIADQQKRDNDLSNSILMARLNSLDNMITLRNQGRYEEAAVAQAQCDELKEISDEYLQMKEDEFEYEEAERRNEAILRKLDEQNRLIKEGNDFEKSYAEELRLRRWAEKNGNGF